MSSISPLGAFRTLQNGTTSKVALAEEIWSAKYRFAPREGDADEDFTGTVGRVAAAIAEAEAPDPDV